MSKYFVIRLLNLSKSSNTLNIAVWAQTIFLKLTSCVDLWCYHNRPPLKRSPAERRLELSQFPSTCHAVRQSLIKWSLLILAYGTSWGGCLRRGKWPLVERLITKGNLWLAFIKYYQRTRWAIDVPCPRTPKAWTWQVQNAKKIACPIRVSTQV